MNSVIRTALRLNTYRHLLHSAKSFTQVGGVAKQQRQFARTLWHMCNFNEKKISLHSDLCSCGCGKREAHTKAEQELVEFLSEEIQAERKAQKSKTIPTEINGFQAKLNGAEVTLTKKVKDETIRIQFNVNHTVDTDPEAEMRPEMDKPEMAELKSKPSFKIDLVRGSTTINLVCSFINPEEQDGYNDIFGIDEISIYDGDWNENVYSVSGEVVDSYLYDLLLNYLDEKGITNEFVEKLSDYSTTYEHSAYIGLLEGLSKFASGK